MTSLNSDPATRFRRIFGSVWIASRLIARNLPTYARHASVGVLFVATLVASGCGDSSGLAPVHGVVTLDGEPLTEGFVFVTPTEGKMAKGTIQPDGTFILGTNSDSDGAQVGTHPVTVLPPTAEEGKPPSVVARSLPNKYSIAATSGITVDVQPNTDNELIIQLSSK